jgi:hypothetical protein
MLMLSVLYVSCLFLLRHEPFWGHLSFVLILFLKGGFTGPTRNEAEFAQHLSIESNRKLLSSSGYEMYGRKNDRLSFMDIMK